MQSSTIGLPKDFITNEVQDQRLHGLISRDTEELVRKDDLPIPHTNDREYYYGDRHYEYWLSGLWNAKRIAEAFPPLLNEKVRVLDFGGATGRVSRHITLLNHNVESWLCDINPRWVSWVEKNFTRPTYAFQNHHFPHLQFEDNTFDLIFAFSVFTHLDADEIPWLLELRRIVKPGGMLYLTVHDDPLWGKLREPGMAWKTKSFAVGEKASEFLDLLNGPIPDRYVIAYSDKEAYNINTFLSRNWMSRRWRPLFTDLSYEYTCQSDVQSVVVLRK